MCQSIIEYARFLSVTNLFRLGSFSSSWPIWKQFIYDRYFTTPTITSEQIFNLGDSLRDIFFTTNISGRSQSAVSTGGASWEALVCWYLNLCTINRPVFIIKHNRNLIPTPINNAITVRYGNFTSNTESDLIALTFPNTSDYMNDKNLIQIAPNGTNLPLYHRDNFQYLNIINALVARDFDQIGVHIIQCKTNWNDNAQIPMLWDAIYSAINFNNNITVGSGGYSPRYLNDFSYSFVTVPSNELGLNNSNFTPTSTKVLRVRNLSGGNYWGCPDAPGVASSVKALVETKLHGNIRQGFHTTLTSAIPLLNTTYSYFDL